MFEFNSNEEESSSSDILTSLLCLNSHVRFTLGGSSLHRGVGVENSAAPMMRSEVVVDAERISDQMKDLQFQSSYDSSLRRHSQSLPELNGGGNVKSAAMAPILSKLKKHSKSNRVKQTQMQRLSRSSECIPTILAPYSGMKQPPVLHCSPSDNLINAEGVELKESSPLYVELDVLTPPPNAYTHRHWIWLQKSRWYRYEEDFDENIGSFGKPFIPPLFLNSISKLKSILNHGVTILNPHLNEPLLEPFDQPTFDYRTCADLVSHLTVAANLCESDAQLVRLCLLEQPHVNGRNRSYWLHEHASSSHNTPQSPLVSMTERCSEGNPPPSTGVTLRATSKKQHPRVKSWSPFMTSVVQAFGRRKASDIFGDRRQSEPEFELVNKLHPVASGDLVKFTSKLHSALESRVEPNAETVSVHVGCIPEMKRTCFCIVRFRQPLHCFNMTELDQICPMRYFVCLLGPPQKYMDYVDVGRVICTMFTDKMFSESMHRARGMTEVVGAIDRFCSDSLVLPMASQLTEATISAMLPHWQQMRDVLLERLAREELRQHHDRCGKQKLIMKSKKNIPGVPVISLRGKGDDNIDSEKQPLMGSSLSNYKKRAVRSELTLTKAGTSPALTQPPQDDATKTESTKRSCCPSSSCTCACCWCPPNGPFSLLRADIATYTSRYLSDFLDPFTAYRAYLPQMLSTILFLYFVMLAPTLTFASLLSNQLSSLWFTMPKALIAVGVSQILFTFVGGQPLLICGITGPTFIIELCIGLFMQNVAVGLPFMRLQVALYCAFFGFIFSACNASRVVDHVRRSVEEVFNFFIATYFIFKSIRSMSALFRLATEQQSDTIYSQRMSEALVTLFTAVIMLSTCLYLAHIKRGVLFRRSIRNVLGFFNVPIGLAFCMILRVTIFSRVNIPTVNVPRNITGLFDVPVRDNVAQWSTLLPTEHVISAMIGLCLALTLTTETALSGLTVAKPERCLKKPCPYALDQFVAVTILPVICGVFCWPFVSPAAVRSNGHVIALTIWDTKTAPGVPHRILGCVEQRVTGVFIGLLVILTMYTDSRVFEVIPMGALYGMFLYMGVMGLSPLIIFKRIGALMRLRKHWKSRDYLDAIPTNTILLFVVIQMSVILMLIIFNLITEFAQIAFTSLLFPFVLVIFAIVREKLLPRIPLLSNHIEQLDLMHMGGSNKEGSDSCYQDDLFDRYAQSVRRHKSAVGFYNIYAHQTNNYDSTSRVTKNRSAEDPEASNADSYAEVESSELLQALHQRHSIAFYMDIQELESRLNNPYNIY